MGTKLVPQEATTSPLNKGERFIIRARQWQRAAFHKLHLDIADSQITIMTMTSERVSYLYDLMDSAYDAAAILEHCRQLGHLPVVDPHGRRATKGPSQLLKIFPKKPKPQLCPAKAERYKERKMVERVNASLKDEFGGRTLRVRGTSKVMAHLMFGFIALTVDKLQKMII